MKLMICGSMSFAKEMLEVQKQLESVGHSVSVPCDAEVHVAAPGFNDDLEADRQHCIENDIMRRCFDLLADADAVLFLNYPKNGIDGYLGTSSLMEMGLAYHLKKKIYLLNPPPSPETARSSHEVLVFQPTVLDGSFDEFLK